MPGSNSSAKRSAKELFAAARDAALHAELATAKAATVANMGKLRALRLARDAEKDADTSCAKVAGTPAKTARRRLQRFKETPC